MASEDLDELLREAKEGLANDCDAMIKATVKRAEKALIMWVAIGLAAYAVVWFFWGSEGVKSWGSSIAVFCGVIIGWRVLAIPIMAAVGIAMEFRLRLVRIDEQLDMVLSYLRHQS